LSLPNEVAFEDVIGSFELNHIRRASVIGLWEGRLGKDVFFSVSAPNMVWSYF
jgi:hypothetical protein